MHALQPNLCMCSCIRADAFLHNRHLPVLEWLGFGTNVAKWAFVGQPNTSRLVPFIRFLLTETDEVGNLESVRCVSCIKCKLPRF